MNYANRNYSESTTCGDKIASLEKLAVELSSNADRTSSKILSVQDKLRASRAKVLSSSPNSQQDLGSAGWNGKRRNYATDSVCQSSLNHQPESAMYKLLREELRSAEAHAAHLQKMNMALMAEVTMTHVRHDNEISGLRKCIKRLQKRNQQSLDLPNSELKISPIERSTENVKTVIAGEESRQMRSSAVCSDDSNSSEDKLKIRQLELEIDEYKLEVKQLQQMKNSRTADSQGQITLLHFELEEYRIKIMEQEELIKNLSRECVKNNSSHV